MTRSSRPARATPVASLAAGFALAALTLLATGCSKPLPVPEAVAPAPPATIDSNTADMDVTTNVKTALLGDDRTKAFDIQVVTTKGDVRMTGVVDSQAQVDAAETLARAATGAHSIHNELTIKP